MTSPAAKVPEEVMSLLPWNTIGARVAEVKDELFNVAVYCREESPVLAI